MQYNYRYKMSSLDGKWIYETSFSRTSEAERFALFCQNNRVTYTELLRGRRRVFELSPESHDRLNVLIYGGLPDRKTASTGERTES